MSVKLVQIELIIPKDLTALSHINEKALLHSVLMLSGLKTLTD